MRTVLILVGALALSVAAARAADPAKDEKVEITGSHIKQRVVRIGHTTGAGHQIVAAPEDAEVIVVNTCGFIGEAKQESIDAILEMARHEGLTVAYVAKLIARLRRAGLVVQR